MIWRLCLLLLALQVCAFGQIVVGPNVDASKRVGNESEPAIAIDPSDTSRMFIASNASGSGLLSSRSGDGGANWTSGIIATGSDPLWSACCDPSVTFDSFG